MHPDRIRFITSRLYLSGLILLAASLPLSRFGMSIAQFLIAGSWLLDGDVVPKVRLFLKNRLALLLAGLYLLHVVGLAWTSDFSYAWKDLRIKLPLLLIPFIFSTGPPVNVASFRIILKIMVAAVTASTLISLLVYVGVINRPVNDIRDISIFISHIRLALMCCLSLFTAIWLISTSQSPRTTAAILIPVMLWLIYFLFLIESLTGLAILLTGGLVMAGLAVRRKYGIPGFRLLVFSAVVLVGVLSAYIHTVNKDFSDQDPIPAQGLDSLTALGNPYIHNTTRIEFENGHRVWTYVCVPELRESWNRRSKMDFSGRDARNQELCMTLIRFLASKGLRKDAGGIAALSDNEIHAVEQGIANVHYQQMGDVRARIQQVLWELHNYQNTGNASGHSLAQRLEYWKAATKIVGRHPFIGVGTGDVPDAFRQQYIDMHSRLTDEWRLRSHNQFLSIGVAFGVPGMCYFLFSLAIPLIRRIRVKDYLYISFSIISILSMTTEDTLETQAGVTFFAFFTGLFLFVNPAFSTTDGKKASDGPETG